jgi:alpha-1,3-rhamnosyl/mannosyltransferase
VLVGIEASAALSAERGGVGNYAAHLIAGLRDLAQKTPALDLIFYSNRYQVRSEDNPAGLAPRDIYARHRLPTRIAWMQCGLPLSIKRTRPDVCHYPNHLGPVVFGAGVPHAVTMHDMSVFRCPEHHTRKTVAVHRAIMPALVRRNAWIVTDSESSRADATESLRVPAERVRVIHPGIGREFSPIVNEGDAAALRRHGVRYPYVLTVGTLEPRKNHARLIAAFDLAMRSDGLPHHLVIVGGRGWKHDALVESMRHSALADRIHVLGFVPTADLPALYRGADSFAFPSLYEGFGLPVLEALASGVTTLISRDPALMETAGKAAGVVRVDALDISDIARGIHSTLTNSGVRERARTTGPQRAAAFSWDRCAARALDLYRTIAEGESVRSRAFAV